MARHDSKEDKAKVRFRFFDFELEGSNAALESTVRTMATTLARRDGNGNAKALASAVAAALPNGHVVEADDVDVDEVDDDAVVVSPRPTTRGKAPKTAVERPEFLDNLVKAASLPLADFVAAHEVGQTDYARCAAIAKWCKTHAGVNTVEIDHFYTGYKLMNWQSPRRYRNPLNDLVDKKDWLRRVGPGKYEITYLGEEAVPKREQA
jgi:hypothetical protein